MPLKVITEGDVKKETIVFSYSSYSTYLQCPQRYWKEKVLKLPKVEDETYTIPGRIVHHAAGTYFESGSLQEFSEDSLKAELFKYSKLPTVNLEKAYGSFDKAFDLVTKSANNLKNFVVTRGSGCEILSEKWFGTWNGPLKVSDNFYLQGAADLIEVNPNQTALLFDFKTSWNTRNASSDQLILYSYAAKVKWGINVTMAAFFLLPTNKLQYVSFILGDQDRLIADMQKAANDILTLRDNLPCKKNDKCVFCPYSSGCEAMKQENAVAQLSEGSVSFGFTAEL